MQSQSALCSRTASKQASLHRTALTTRSGTRGLRASDVVVLQGVLSSQPLETCLPSVKGEQLTEGCHHRKVGVYCCVESPRRQESLIGPTFEATRNLETGQVCLSSAAHACMIPRNRKQLGTQTSLLPTVPGAVIQHQQPSPARCPNHWELDITMTLAVRQRHTRA